jgi:hypothetical protein
MDDAQTNSQARLDHGIHASKEPLLEWTAPSHPVHERSPRWYLFGAVIVLASAAYGILTGAWTVALASILVGGVYFLLRKEPVTYKHIALLPAGYMLDGAFTFWGDCKEFWIIHTSAHTELHILKNRGPAKETIVQTAAIDPTQIRSILSQFIKMRPDQKERLLDAFIHFCKL